MTQIQKHQLQHDAEAVSDNQCSKGGYPNSFSHS